MTTPREDGFALPPEWAPHSRCWMAWPCRSDLWGERLGAARQAFAEIARAIADFEPVTVIARPQLTAEASLQLGQGISVLPMAHDDSWMRDTGPTFVTDGRDRLAGVDWRFNGWGERAPAWEQDAAIARAVLERINVPRYEAPVVLEGGAIHVDGEGTCLACEASVLDPRRNPGLSRDEMEAVLRDHLGVETVVWLKAGLVGDPSGGHVDNLACFVRPGAVLALVTRDPNDDNHPILADNLARLRAATDARGRTLEVLEVEQPARRARDDDGRRLPLSYVNFYLANGAVIVPMFDDGKDKAARTAISAAFPDRQLIPIDASDLVYGGGGIHCITQQQPATAPPA
ncbi:MAG TPA: agmatine deiminase family protein, partial [Geminicoccaceae bacterium]|nr:agmatine deiminase family protein [Geminicoccaceae bacterium]